jgi:hypothetical protein
MKETFRENPTFMVNPPSQDDEKTVVVLGTYRGGTSMVAKMLRDLGVPMGWCQIGPSDPYDSAEDAEFRDLLHRMDLLDKTQLSAYDFSSAGLDALTGLIWRRDAAHQIWGWKFPGTVKWLLHSGLAARLRNPHFITVFRDPLAVFQHQTAIGWINPANVRSQTERSFQWVMSEFQRLTDHVMACTYPHLLVSFERTVMGGAAAKRALVESCVRFLEPALEMPAIDAAIRAISYDDPKGVKLAS